MIEKSPNSGSAQNKPLGTASTKGEARTTVGASTETRASKLYEVEIAGVPLRLKSSHDEQTVNELVANVDQKVREALPLTKTGSIQNAAILASLHLAEENLTLRRKAMSMLEKLENKTQKVISELENSRMSGFQNVPRAPENIGPHASSSNDGASPADFDSDHGSNLDL